MNKYYAAYDKIDFGYYPNYSFEIGDINGDGKKEFVSMDQSGNLLKAMNLDGDLLFEKKLNNNGNWGTPLVCIEDIDNDGRGEIIVPDAGKIIAFDGKGNKIRERVFEGCKKDDYGIALPLIGAAHIISPDKNSPGINSIIACCAGGTVYALDADFRTIWKADGFKNDYGHEIHFTDTDGDGFDEIAFCSVDHINGGRAADNSGELILLDHDGTLLLRKRVDSYIDDTHFDDIAMADFLGNGTCQILVEKGLLLDTKGNIIWDLSNEMEHGQWITHIPGPDGKGKLVFISELWGNAKKSMLFTGAGRKIYDIKNLQWPESAEPDITLLPSRCHIIQWDANSEPEIFLAQQSCSNKEKHNCTQTRHFRLTGLFLDINGNLKGQMPFSDSRIKGYYYNGETHSRAADVDGDGHPEIVFPRQDGHVMIIKRETVK